MYTSLPKRILAIHDICGIGRCSLYSVISLLTHLGNSVCPLPTATFSTNTHYKGFQWKDLSDTLNNFLEDYQKKNIVFDSIYSGYLGNEIQTESIQKASFLWPESFKVIDPVFADEGKLYSHFELSIIDAFKDLIKQANLITPNVTEASFLVSRKPDSFKNLQDVKEAARQLSQDGHKNVVITGIELEENLSEIKVVAFDKKTKKIIIFSKNKIANVNFCGTGDTFTSCLLGLYLKGKSFEDSIKTSLNFIEESINLTLSSKKPFEEGIIFEPLLKDLV